MNNEKLIVYFFETKIGNQPCRDFILTLSENDKKEVGIKIFMVQTGFPMGLPLVRKMQENLWEIRINIFAGICRIFFTVSGKYLILLHGFVKKTNKTPAKELRIALTRLREFQEVNK